MKRVILMLAMATGVMVYATDTCASFDDTGWQQGPSDDWFVNWDKAVAESKKVDKPIFVLKTGSDWCGWCIRLRKNVLTKPEFADFAKKNLVLLYLDSPKKKPLGEEQKRHNREVSRNLGLGGGVPNATVVTADGKKLGAIGGGGLGVEDYLKKLEGILRRSPEGNGNEATLSPRQSAGKMPSQFMPTKGLLVSFDYDDGKETNAGYGEVRRENDHVQFADGAADYDGVYKYSVRGGRFKEGDRFEEDYVVPELNFDRFTVACSFRSAHTNNWGQYFFRIGRTCYSILEVSLSGGKVSVRGRKLKNLSAPYADKEWNWLVISVDLPRREAWLSVNGCEPVSTSLPEDFFWFIPSDRVLGDGFRRLAFGNWQCGERYRGQVDDLMVYDRALGREEFAGVCKRAVKAEGRAVASFEKAAPVRLPELRDDRWLFIPHNEQSVYWNGTVRTKNASLKVRREGDGLCVEPPEGIVGPALDLTLSVADASGRPLSIVGIGSECDPYCICARKHSLVDVRLPDTLKTIRKNAFAGCEKLESIVIPENVREIGSFAFADCRHLTKLEIRSKAMTIAKDAFRGSTPVGQKMSELRSPVGPIVVTATGRDDEKDVKPEVSKRRVLGGMARRRIEMEQQKREDPAKTTKSVKPVIKQYKLRYADPKEVARLIGQMFGNCKALCEERIGLVNVELPPDELARVEQFIQGLDIRPTELKLDLKVVRVADVESVDSALAKLTAAPDKAEVVFEQSVIAKENVDVHATGLFAVCGKPTVLRFRCRSKSPALQSGDAPVEWEIACSNESGVVCALNGAQVIDGYGATTLGGFMVEECSGLFAFLQPAGINAAYLFQLSAKDLGQVLALQAGATESKNADLGGQGYGIEEKMLDEKCQEDLRRLAAQIRKKKLAAEK